jgi:tetratricopeptide (TPR) repeat protein
MSTENLTQEQIAAQNYEVPLEQALELAKGHHQNSNFVLAERTYRDILNTVPKHFPTTQLLGALLFQCGYYDEAKEHFADALAENPESVGCLNNCAGVSLQLGDYEDALIYLDRALEIDRNFVDALSNKAYALWQLERFDEAEAVASHILTIEPDNVNALNSLGIALSKQFRYEESFDAWEKALELDPENAMCASNWGNALRDMGRIAEGREKCKAAYDLDDEDPIVISNYANGLRDGGKPSEAIEIYKKATDLRPDFPEAHANMALALIDEGLYKDAAIAARYAVAFNRRLTQAYAALSHAEYSMGNLEQAHIAAQTAVKYANEEEAQPYINLAEVLEGLDQYDDAEAAIAEALRRQPESARAYIKLAEIRQYMHRYDEAHQVIDRALELSPQMAKANLTKGTLYFHQLKTDEALEYIQKASDLAPKWNSPLVQKAELLAALGRFEESEEVLNKMMENNDKIPAAYNILSTFKKFDSQEDPVFKKMLAFEEKIETYGVQVESAYYLSLATIFETFGEYDRAFEYLKKGNDAKKKLVSGERSLANQETYIEANKSAYTPEVMEKVKGYGNDSSQPIFILGMPRSGTTLTEQIISSHPDVTPGGELTFMGHVHSNVSLNHVSDLKAAADEYLKLARDFIGIDDKTRFTDKMPGNHMLIGLIHALLPNAKIIYCKRNAIDNCLSCYQQNFYMGHYWSYDQEDLATYYKNHEGMMDYWRELLPDGFLEINYEETVGNFEEQARKLIDYVGLEWDDACLKPHKLKRTVMTASRAQVTQPIYKTSVEKWRKYEKGLQPLVRAIDPSLAMPEEKKAKPKKKAKK